MAEILKTLRRKKNLTQNELASLLGTSQQQVQRLENGARKLTFDWITKLSKVLDVDPSVFFNENREYAADSFEKQNRLSDSSQSDSAFYEQSGGHKRVPVYGVKSSDIDCYVLNSNFISEKVIEPSLLYGVKDGFLIDIAHTDMIPRYFPGERIAVHPYKKPMPSQDCVVVDKNDRAFIRVFEYQDKNTICTRKYNPESRETFDLGEIKGLYVILGRF